VLADGETQTDFIETASISDENGNLLFYTNGQNIFNKYHEIMEDSTYSLGNLEIPIIIPFPNDENRYYIFTRWVHFGKNGLILDYLYTIVNMENGDGVVEDLHQFFFRSSLSERGEMIATLHSDNESFWLIIDDTHEFQIFKIHDSVIDSPITMEHGMEGGAASDEFLDLTFSLDSNFIAGTVFHITPSGSMFTSLDIFDFNNSTGEVELKYHNYYSNFGDIWLAMSYQLAFSPNSNYLYVADSYYSIILQLDMNNLTAITHEYITLTDYSQSFVELENNMKLAIDGKIYIPGLNSLNQISVINNPNNNLSNANYMPNVIDLSLGQGRYTRYLPDLVPIHEVSCQNTLDIVQNVYLGETDIQDASNTVIATNTIFSGGTAEYDAGDYVLLDVGFSADAGAISKTEYSHFYAYIDGCESGGGSGDIKGRYVNNNSNTDSLHEESILNIFPNPSDGRFSIDYPFKENVIYKLEIFDSSFILRHVKNLSVDNNIIDVRDLKESMYTLRLSTDKEVLTRHFVISK
jgi:hypothetical protein